jgi:hypothetical protein
MPSGSHTDDPIGKKDKAEEGIDKVTVKGEEDISTDEETINAEQKFSEDHDK